MKLPKPDITLLKKIKMPKLPAMSKTQKILAVVVAVVLLADIVAAVFLIANKNQSAVRLAALGEEKANRLYALDSAASKGTISKPGFANFKFTDQQKIIFQTENTWTAEPSPGVFLPCERSGVIVSMLYLGTPGIKAGLFFVQWDIIVP